MAGTYSIKSLADGQLPNAKGTLYTVPGSTQAIVKTIILVNTDTSARTVNLYVNTGTSRKIIPVDTELGVGYSLIFDDELTLEAADLIEGDASVASKVDYYIGGIEES